MRGGDAHDAHGHARVGDRRQHSLAAALPDPDLRALGHAEAGQRQRVEPCPRRSCVGGLLQRRRTKNDARAYAVTLTDEGWRVLRSTEPMVRRVDDRILAMLPSKQRDQFLSDLMTIVEALQTPTAPAGRRG